MTTIHTINYSFIRLLFLLVSLAMPGLSLASTKVDQPSERELKKLVAQICEKELVFLGESSNHGERKVWQTKGQLLKLLIEDCGFNTVLIESGMYDYINFDRALGKGSATEKMLKNAVGRVWSNAESSNTWIPYLFEMASKQKIVIGGIDDQIHSTAEFVKTKLPGQLSTYLKGKAREACESSMLDYANWRYTQQKPFDVRRRDELVDCLAEIEKSIEEVESLSKEKDLMMTRSLKRFFGRQMKGREGFNLRESSMFENFNDYHQVLPKGRKFILWGATIHGVKVVPERLAKHKIKVLGQYLHEKLGGAMATIGFSALSGEYAAIGKKGKVYRLSEVPDDSIEAHANLNEQALTYLDSKVLMSSGKIKGRVLNNQFENAYWSELLDGIIVIRNEEAPIIIKK